MQRVSKAHLQAQRNPPPCSTARNTGIAKFDFRRRPRAHTRTAGASPMSSNTASIVPPGITTAAPDKSNIRWFVCALLFAATTINYMDRSVFSFIEPLLHLPFMGWIPGLDAAHQPAYDINFGRVLICFQIAYGVGFLFPGRIIDNLGTKTGYALAILVWGCASISHSLV